MTKWEALKKELESEIKKEQKAVNKSIKEKDYANAFACNSELQTLGFVLGVLMPKIENEII